MLVRASGFALVFSIARFNSSSAQEAPDRTMINTLRCEAGRVGQKLAAAGVTDGQQALVTWKSTKTVSSGGGLGLKFPFFSIGGSGDLSNEDLNEGLSDGLSFNLHPDNATVCRTVRRKIIKEGVGLYNCLASRKFDSLQYALKSGAGSTGCHQKITLAKKLSGSLRLNMWGVDVGPSGSWGDSYVYDIVIAAPPKKK